MTEAAPAPPRWRRRKTARPGEIAAAALAVFAENGFAAARLEDVAKRAGVSKAALYLYYPTKSDLFRAVVAEAALPNLERVKAMAALDQPFDVTVRQLLAGVAMIAGAAPVGPVAKMVIGESRNFPDLARVWHDAVVSQVLAMLAGVVERAQARGEVRAGDPRLYALTLAGPMVMGILWREVFAPIGAEPFDLSALADQHASAVLDGMRERRAA
jgi:AcrR family transcriptional regulator